MSIDQTTESTAQSPQAATTASASVERNPVEPTPEMLESMDKGSAYQTWKNMLAAAPSQPVEPGKEGV